jgi:hypothetical protein
VCRFLEVGQLLLGQFTLAAVSHDQLVTLYFQMLHIAARAQLLLEFAHSVRQGDLLHLFVVGVSGLVMTGYIAVVAARKLERRVVMF